VKILVLADCESKSLYEYFTPEKLEGVELILACGDLKESYLDFFASMTSAPVLFVMGNHDEPYTPGSYSGCVCIEDDIYVYRGIRILGLGGSMRYIPQVENQYSEKEMRKRIRRLWWKLKKNQGFDILVSHAPAAGINDLSDLPHKGFVCFCDLLNRYKPRLFVHGHVHANYGTGFKRVDQVGDTVVVNAYDYYILDYPEEKGPC
jgi:Icc-related predicted phosphoesterase